jgi:type II secretory pathway component PulF
VKRPPETEPDGEEPTTFRPNPNRPAPDRPGDEPNVFRPRPKKPASGRAEGRSSNEPKPVTGGPSLWERIFFGSVSTGHLAIFCRQFGAYLDAGVDLVKSLSSLERQFARTALGPVIARMLLSVRQGDALAEAVGREPQAFDPLFVSMTRVAEARGGMPETLKLMAHHYEARQSLIRQARSAMIYPIAVLIVAAGVVAMLTYWLLPMFVELLRDVAGRGAQLPLPSRVLMAFSDFVKLLGWWLIPLVMIGLPLLLFRFYKTRAGKRLMDGLALYVPVFGKLLSKIDTTRFARTLGALLEAGVDVNSSLELTSDVLHLDPFRRAVRYAKQEVMDGRELSASLDDTRRFTPDVIAIIESGEETGKLPETLNHLADEYEEQVAYMVRNLGQLVQPLLIIVLGGVVLFIILAVLLPYIQVLTSLSR